VGEVLNAFAYGMDGSDGAFKASRRQNERPATRPEEGNRS
jgi:hypothetical protein